MAMMPATELQQADQKGYGMDVLNQLGWRDDVLAAFWFGCFRRGSAMSMRRYFVQLPTERFGLTRNLGSPANCFSTRSKVARYVPLQERPLWTSRLCSGKP